MRLRYAVRVLIKSPAFALTAIVMLALCIGANTAIFTLVDRVLLRPLPYPHPERLAMVVREYRGNNVAADEDGQAGVTWRALNEGAAEKLQFALSTGSFSDGVNLVAAGRAVYVAQYRVSAGYFRVLGVAPELGREFDEDDDRPNGPAVVVLSHALWAQAFNADPAIVGKAVTVRGEPSTIVGVMPASLSQTLKADLWLPARPTTTGEGSGENYEIIARLTDGVSWSEADAAVAAATDTVVRDRYRRDVGHVRIGIAPLQRARAQTVREPLIVLWAAVGIVLVIGCVNIGGLSIARANTRAAEIALRLALGAGRGAIVRQLLGESFVIAICGGALGIALGDGLSRLASSLLTSAFGVAPADGLDGRVLAITATASLATSVAFGLLPAVSATRVDLRQALVESGSGSIAGSARRWPRQAIVATEVALGVILLVGAGLLIRTFDRLMQLPPGFDGTHVMTATLSLQDARYRTADRVNQLIDRSVAQMREIPGVEHAAVALTLPYERPLNIGGRWVAQAPSQRPIAIMNMTYVSPEYFDTLRIPVLRGRAFTAADTASRSGVIVVNQAFVNRYSPDGDVIGRQISSGNTVRTIVGVVGDVMQKSSFGNSGPVAANAAAYIPAAQTDDAFLVLVHTWFSPSWFVRTAGWQSGVSVQMQRAMERVDPTLPFAKLRVLDDVRDEAVAAQRARAVLLASLAAVALLLAAIGLSGLVSHAVAERTRELGIRIALGATRTRAIVTAARPPLVLAAVGLVSGLAAARAASQMLRHLVWGVSVTDPITFLVAAIVVAAVAVIATLIPSLAVVRIDPIGALRQP